MTQTISHPAPFPPPPESQSGLLACLDLWAQGLEPGRPLPLGDQKSLEKC